MITSLSNPRVKEAAELVKKASARKERGLFVVEGRRFAGEIPPERLAAAYATPEFAESPEGAPLCERLGAELVSPPVMAKMSDTKSLQGILALVRMENGGSQAFRKEGPLLALERIQDPGNLGTLFRTAEAAGAAGLILDRETADPYSPKALRSTMGAIFRMPFIMADSMQERLAEYKSQGYRLLAAHLAGQKNYDAADYDGKTIIMLGNEGNGLSQALADMADELVRIPMEGQAESLNVAVAGALLLYEARRQRSNSGQY